jgi:Zinc finger C-x8-C-x5-C-x3-H type (and similar)
VPLGSRAEAICSVVTVSCRARFADSACTTGSCLVGSNGEQLVLFGIKNRTFGSCLAAAHADPCPSNALCRGSQGLQGRFYAGRPILVEFSPVTDFREATCRQYEENTCTRGGYCNFMHLRPISRGLRKELFGRYKRRSRSRSRSRDRWAVCGREAACPVLHAK